MVSRIAALHDHQGESDQGGAKGRPTGAGRGMRQPGLPPERQRPQAGSAKFDVEQVLAVDEKLSFPRGEHPLEIAAGVAVGETPVGERAWRPENARSAALWAGATR